MDELPHSSTCTISLFSPPKTTSAIQIMPQNPNVAKSGEGQHRRRGRDDLAAAIVLAVVIGGCEA